MEHVIFSGYVSVRELVFVYRFLNKTCYDAIRIKCRQSLILKHRKGKTFLYPPWTRYMTCDKCHTPKRACSEDLFRSVKGMLCHACKPALMSLTQTRDFLDERIISLMDRIENGPCTYFLKEDVKAYDFLFTGPHDRRIEKELKRVQEQQKRTQEVKDLFQVCKVHENDYDTLIVSRYIREYEKRGAYGLRRLKKLVLKGYKPAKQEWTRLNATVTDISLAQCLDWTVDQTQYPKRFVVNGKHIRPQIQNHIEQCQRRKQALIDRDERRERLSTRLAQLDIHKRYVDAHMYSQYIYNGTPALDTVLSNTHRRYWLLTKTPFTDILHHLIMTRPILPTSYPEEAERVVTTMGYTYTPL